MENAEIDSPEPAGAEGVQLSQVPLFKNLPAHELRSLSEALALREVPAGMLLFREGEVGDRLCILSSGQVEVIKALDLGDEYQVTVLGPGEFVGDLSFLNPDGLRTASVRTRSPVKLWEMKHADLNGLLSRQPQLIYELVRVLGARLTESDNAIIRDLRAKNRQLVNAYEALQAAQTQIVEKEKLERELQVAYEIQMSILPKSLPRLQGFDFGALIVPARIVGGDFFDLIPLGQDRMGIVVGDVADKGVPAAILMARTHALIYAEAYQCPTPGEVLKRVNRHLMKLCQPTLFVTVLFGILNRRSRNFEYARAGHDLPLLIGPDGQGNQAPFDPGQVLGLLEDPLIDEQVLTIPPGGTLLLYTDGITDSRNPQGEFFGVERLLGAVRELAGQPAQATCEGLYQRLLAFQGNEHLEDDVTLVAVCSAGVSD